MSSTGRLPGIPFAIIAAALFGASTPIAKLLLGDISPWLLAGILYLGSGAGLAVFYGVRRLLRAAPAEAPLRRADVPWLAAVTLVGGVAGPLLLMVGLASSSAAATSLLLNVEGLATMAIAWVVFRENVDGRLLVGAAAILAGAVLLSWHSGPGRFELGALAVVGACVAWGIDNNLTRRISASDPVQIAAIKGLVAGAVNLMLALSLGGATLRLAALPAAALVGFLGYGVSLVLYVLALRHLGAARTGAYFAAAPFLGAVLAIGLLGEPITLPLAASAALMAIGLYLHLSERHEHKHVHEAMDHEHRHVHDAHHQHAHSPDDPPGEPHTHRHRHVAMVHSHAHFPDLHHRHTHAHKS
jgi:drug/metabolite transporter (DMT)-like permease